MMFLLGICSIFQMIFLPGFLVIKPLNIQGKIRILIFSFALSLIMNYLIVFLLVRLGLYIRTIVLIIFVIEMLIFLIMIYPSLNQPVLTIKMRSTLFISSLRNTTNGIKHNPYSLIQFMLRFTIIALATITILWYTKQLLINIGQVFTSWDAVMSWNLWAIGWSENKIVMMWSNWQYPQLLPANWSLTYVFTDSKLEFFAKSIMALFPLYILLLMLDLALREKSIGHYIGIIATGILIRILLGDYISEGYADIPVSFFVFLAIYSLMVSYNASDLAIKKKFLLLGAAFSVGAAFTKFPGILFAFLYPFLSFFIIFKNIKSMKPYDKFKIIALIFIVFVVIGVIATPWDIYKYAGSYLLRFKMDQLISAKNTIQLINSKIPITYIFFFIAFPLFFSFFDRIYRLIITTLICPILCLWVFFYGTDVRYLATAIPLIGLSVGKGIENMASLAQRAWQKFTKTHIINMRAATENNDTVLYNNTVQQQPLFRIKLFEILIFLAFFLVLPTLFYNRAYLTNRQISLQKQIGYRPINEMVYNYQNNNILSGKIISNYQYLGHLPGLEKFYEFEVFKIFEEYNFHRQEPDVQYIVIMYEPGWGVDQKIIDDINKRIRRGEYQLIDDKNSVLFVKIR